MFALRSALLIHVFILNSLVAFANDSTMIMHFYSCLSIRIFKEYLFTDKRRVTHILVKILAIYRLPIYDKYKQEFMP